MSQVFCKCCNREITNPDLKYVYYQEDYPSIDIGPYCENCWIKIRVCTECQHPFEVDNGIKYYGRGKYVCTSCAEHLEICDHCGVIGSIVLTHEGKKYCSSCKSTLFFDCPSCGDIHTIAHVKRPFRDNLTSARFPEQFKRFGKDLCEKCFTKITFGVKPKPVNTCNHCGSFYDTDSWGHKVWCKTCYENFNVCSLCGDRHPKVDRVYARGPKGGRSTMMLCLHCKDKKIFKCDTCSLYSTRIHTKKILGNVTRICSSCDSVKIKKSFCTVCLKYSEVNSKGICELCSSNYGDDRKCGICGSLRDTRGACRTCEPYVSNYTLKPPIHFLYTQRDIDKEETLFFGFENEESFSGSSKAERGLRSLYEKFSTEILTAKSDSSIDGPGFEVVTQPMTLRYFKSFDVESLFPDGIRASKSCGLHVHINRSFIKSELHLFKIMKFIYTNESFIDRIAGRTYSSYNGKISEKISKAVKEKKGLGRHQRVNITNETTIEFRMFQGCTDEYTLRYRIEFIHAMCHWSTTASIKETQTTDSFEKYVMSHKKLYPNLVQFLSN